MGLIDPDDPNGKGLVPQEMTSPSAGEPLADEEVGDLPDDEESDDLTAPQILFTVTRVQDLPSASGTTVAERVELTPAGTSADHVAHLDPGHQQASGFTFTVSNPRYLHFFEPGKFVVAHFERVEPEEAVAIAQPRVAASA